MTSVLIRLNTANDVKDFVDIASGYCFKINLCCEKYVVNAKSIIGIFSLDITKNIELDAEVDENSKFFEDIKKYIVDWVVFTTQFYII